MVQAIWKLSSGLFKVAILRFQVKINGEEESPIEPNQYFPYITHQPT